MRVSVWIQTQDSRWARPIKCWQPRCAPSRNGKESPCPPWTSGRWSCSRAAACCHPGRQSLCTTAWFNLDERWRSTLSSTTSEPRLSQPDRASMHGCSPGLGWLLRRLPRKHRRCICKLCGFSFAGCPGRQYSRTGQRRLSDQTLAEYSEWSYDQHDTGHGQQDACSSAVSASKTPTTCVTKLPLGFRFSRAL